MLAVGRQYSDRPAKEPSWSTSAEAGLRTGDEFRVTIGDIPAAVFDAVRADRGWRRSLLYRTLDTGKSDDLEESYVEGLPDPEAVRSELTLDGHTYLTFEVSRPVTVHGRAARVHRWVQDADVLNRLEEFAAEGSEFLDVATARLLPALPLDLVPTKIVYRSRTAYLVAEGKTPVSLPTLTESAGSIVAVTGGWNAVNWDAIAAVGRSIGYGKDQYHRLTRTASRWLWAALEQSDNLRCFQFAFFGLEVLTNKAGTQFEHAVAAALSDELGGLPLDVMFWPAPPDAPWRNLVFRFAVMATHLNREGAASDIEYFKSLIKARNALAHGQAGANDLDELPASGAVTLLRDYLRRLAKAGLANSAM